MISFITCTFKGEDGSQGFRKGRRYNLSVYKPTWLERMLNNYPYHWRIIIWRPFIDGARMIPYETDEAFEANWDKCAKELSTV